MTYVWITQKTYSYPSAAIYIYQYMCQDSGSIIISGFCTSKVTEAFRTTTVLHWLKALCKVFEDRKNYIRTASYVRGHFGVKVDLNECR